MYIPSLPRHAELARLLLKQEDCGLPDVAQLVKQDPPLTARLLRGVNSAAYSLSEPICVPAHAASVMGMKGMRNLIMRAPTFDEKRVQAETGFDVTTLWSDAQCTAALCGWLPGRRPLVGQFDTEVLEIHGLLCDIGRFAMFDGLGDEFSEVCVQAREQGRPLVEVEKERLGFSHNELGAMLVKRWSLPEDFVKTTRFHHNEMRFAEADVLVATVYLAALIVEFRIPADLEFEKALPSTVEALGEEVAEGVEKMLEVDADLLEQALRWLAVREAEKRAA